MLKTMPIKVQMTYTLHLTFYHTVLQKRRKYRAFYELGEFLAKKYVQGYHLSMRFQGRTLRYIYMGRVSF